MKMTRREAADELLRLILKGPDLGLTVRSRELRVEMQHRHRIWAESWAVPLLRQLIPELRDAPNA